MTKGKRDSGCDEKLQQERVHQESQKGETFFYYYYYLVENWRSTYGLRPMHLFAY
jgi:hypothetical protein